MSKPIAFFKLIRWPNLLIIIGMQYISSIFLVGPKVDWSDYLFDYHLFLLSISTAMIAAAGNIINDYFDVKIDQINKPNEVIIGRFIRRRDGILSHQILNFFGILIGLFLNPKIGVINFLAATALWFYSERFKRQAFVGNFLVALLTFLSVFIVGIYYEKGRRIILIYSLFAFMITLIREIIKDMEDIRGDTRFGCQTIPVIWGIRKTKIFIFILLSIFVAEIGILSIPIHNLVIYIIFSLLLIPVFYLARKLYSADKKSDFHQLSIFCKYIMLIGIGSMVFN